MVDHSGSWLTMVNPGFGPTCILLNVTIVLTAFDQISPRIVATLESTITKPPSNTTSTQRYPIKYVKQNVDWTRDSGKQQFVRTDVHYES